MRHMREKVVCKLQRVDNKLLYHVDSRGSLRQGMVVESLPVDSSRELQSLFPGGISHFGAGRLLSDQDDDIARMEQLLDTVRRKHVEPKVGVLPSRIECLYAFGSLNDAIQFRSLQQPPSNVWRVRGSGIRVDMNWIDIRLLDVHNNAVRYWCGVPSNAPTWEYLLRLPVTIVEPVDVE